jgi:signal transduction histidine kinase
MDAQGEAPAAGEGRREAATAGSRRAPAERELVGSLAWLIRLRWIAGVAVLGATALARNALGVDLPPAVYLVGVAILVYNAGLAGLCRWYTTRRACPLSSYEWFARAQIGLDWLAMAALIHLSGGVESPALTFFLFHITIASLLLPHAHGFLYVSLAPALVGGVALLEFAEALPHVTLVAPPRYRDPIYVASVIVFFAVACYVLAYFSMSIARRLRRRETEINGLYESIRDTTSTLDLQDVLNRFVESAARVLGCKAAALRLIGAARGQVAFAASWGLSDAYLAGVPKEFHRSRLDQETLEGRPVFVADVGTDPRVSELPGLREEGIGSMLSVPLLSSSGPIGILRAYGAEGHRFTGEDAAYLSAIAAHGVVAIENAQAYQVLTDLDRRKSRFVRMATHELRAPVVVAESLLTALEKQYAGTLNADQTDMVQRAVRRLESLKALIDDLLDLAAGKAEMRPGRARAVNLAAVAGEVCDRLGVMAREKGLALDIDGESSGLDVLIEPTDLERILTNLVSNAVKYTQKGSVRISVSRAEDEARLVVADTGIGIPESAMPYLFQEFYRAANAKQVEDTGTGLGLAIVKDLVERHGGGVTADSREGIGTTFTITLPLAPVGTPSAPMRGSVAGIR